MKYAILATCGALAVATTLTVSAQTPTSTPRPPSPTPAPSTPTMSKSGPDDKTITVTGCLKNWDNSMGTAPAGTGATTYVLTNVESDDTMAKPKPEGTAAMAQSTVATQYVLTAASSVNLTAHLNHKVRVSGTTSKMAGHSAVGATAPSDTRKPGESDKGKPGDPSRPVMDRAGDKAQAKLNVTSVTMVSATCPAQSQ